MAERIRRTAILVVLALAQAAAVVVVHRVFVATLTGRYVETASITGARIGFSRIEEIVYGVLDAVSVASVLAAIVLVVVVALLRRRFVLAAATATMIVGANLTTQVLKRFVFDRPGVPTVLPGGVNGSLENTLPSGHTTVALSVAIAFVLVVPRRLRGLVAVLAAGYGALTGVGTLSAQWHRPSDVIAAGLVVGAWAAAVGAVAVVLSRRKSRRGAPRAWSLPLLTVLGLVLFAGGALALVLTMHTAPSALGDDGLFVAYVGGAAAITGACCALVAGVLVIAPWVVADDPEPAGRAPDRGDLSEPRGAVAH